MKAIVRKILPGSFINKVKKIMFYLRKIQHSGLIKKTHEVLFYFKYITSPQSLLPKTVSSDLNPHELFLLVQDKWYHDFSVLGFPTPQKPGIYGPNQECKQEPIFRFINRALSLCHQEKASINGVELFCADGFYSNYAAIKSSAEIYGVDIDNYNLSKARLITKVLGHSDRITFENCDVFKLSGEYDFGICAGGLYHIANPQDLLKLLATKIRTALVIQTVYSLANTSDNYFETPAPDWTWGCRFSYSYLLHMVKEAGWKVIDEYKNELYTNPRLDDKGSAYLLCIPFNALSSNDTASNTD